MKIAVIRPEECTLRNTCYSKFSLCHHFLGVSSKGVIRCGRSVPWPIPKFRKGDEIERGIVRDVILEDDIIYILESGVRVQESKLRESHE